MELPFEMFLPVLRWGNRAVTIGEGPDRLTAVILDSNVDLNHDDEAVSDAPVRDSFGENLLFKFFPFRHRQKAVLL